MASLLLLAAIALLICAVATSTGDDNILEPSTSDCSTTNNYTKDSQYKNLDQLLAALPAKALGNGWFYEDRAGAGADQVFGLIDHVLRRLQRDGVPRLSHQGARWHPEVLPGQPER
jgi:hypothetical protein